MIWPFRKPSVLSTAISALLSLSVMLIVLAVTSSIMKATATPTLLRKKARSPAMAMTPARKACSVSVRV